MMRKFSLVTEISLMVAISIFVVAISIYMITSRRIETQYKAERQKQFTVLAENITNSIKDFLASDQREEMTQAVGKLIQDREDLQLCLVTNDRGEVVFNSTLKKLGRKYNPAGESWGAKAQFLERDIKSGTLQLGRLVLIYTIPSPVESERERNFVQIGKSIATGIGTLIREFDLYHVGQLIKRIGKSYPDVLYITVYDSSGAIFDEYRREEKAGPPGGKVGELAESVNLLKPVLVQRYAGRGADALDIAVLVEDRGEKVGYVRLGYSMASLNAEMRAQQNRLWEIGLALVILGILVSLTIARRVANPIQILSGAAHEVGSGNMNVSVDIDSGGREVRELARNFNEMTKGLRERDRIRDTFSKYVSKQIAQELLDNPDKVVLGGERRDVVSLFCDIRDFTSISEQETPEKVVELLNEFFSEMVPIIFKYEGTLDKYIGDAFMAVFGSPVEVDHSADKAIECAMEIQRHMIDLNKKWADENRRNFGVGIGLNYGPAISGNIGFEERMEYTVIGDSVNVAARVEKLTRTYSANIIVTENLLKHATKNYPVKFIKKILVKGKNEHIEIYEISV